MSGSFSFLGGLSGLLQLFFGNNTVLYQAPGQARKIGLGCCCCHAFQDVALSPSVTVSLIQPLDSTRFCAEVHSY